jgi:hypothetical protein
VIRGTGGRKPESGIRGLEIFVACGQAV